MVYDMTLIKVLYTLHEGKLRFKIFTEIKRATHIKKPNLWAGAEVIATKFNVANTMKNFYTLDYIHEKCIRVL